MSDAVVTKHVGVLGATNFVGACLLPLLTEAGCQVTAFSRQTIDAPTNVVKWRQLPLYSSQPIGKEGGIPYWICAAPIWVLPEYFALLEEAGVRRVIALSSTSRFTKEQSTDPEEQLVAQRLMDAENKLASWAEGKGIEWVTFRPTLIYYLGFDKNITEIAHFIDRFKFFPLFGKALGLRQPVHASDVASACVAALNISTGVNRAYNLSGGETLSYREMVTRVFYMVGKQPRFISIPLSLFKVVVICARCLPRYRYWSASMAERMNEDLVFDHAEARKVLGYKPKAFTLPKRL